MTRTFVYALWTDPTDPKRTQEKILKRNLAEAAQYVYSPTPLIMYCWGKDNQRIARSLGFDAVKVDDRPTVWGLDGGSMWRHKIEAWRLAMQQYDEIVFLDLDIRPLCPLPADFWHRMAEKQPFQANLLQYKRRRSPWRLAEPRKSPSAAFVYLADKAITGELEEISAQHPHWTEEQCLGYYADMISGGWKGAAYWGEHFEPYCCRLPTKSAMPLTIQSSKEHLFTY